MTEEANVPGQASDELRQTFDRLMEVIDRRFQERPEGSYTTRLFEGGAEKIGKKIIEEAAEVVEASLEPGDKGREHFIYEVGDLLYHVFVMLGYKQIPLDSVREELARRFGVSGLTEKANRTNKS